jgi:hypothetical protein
VSFAPRLLPAAKQIITDAAIVFAVIVVAWLATLDDCFSDSGLQCETAARD